MVMKSSKINGHILRYIEMVECGEIEACKEQHQLVAHIRNCFKTEDIYTDSEQLENYLGLAKYFPYEKLFEWEEFLIALHCCTYRRNDSMPRWPDLLMLVGRGAGKDGFIAYESLCLISPYNGIPNYDIDICANNEEQARTPFEDVWNVLEAPNQRNKLLKFFYWNKVEITCRQTKSKIKYRTNSPKGKDGLRSGAVAFNEIHQYENYENIKVFVTGLGKKKHPRRLYATTDGDVREGPLDDKKDEANAILEGGMPDNGLLPFICKLDSKEEVHDPANWEKANPSLRYRPDLFEEIKKEYREGQKNQSIFSALMTKRMNMPEGRDEIKVTDWDNIKATNKLIPNLEGKSCVVGIDFTMVTDMVSVDCHFRDGDTRYDINHTWLCLNSLDIPRMKAPWREWAAEGLLTLVDDVEISPYLITDYIFQVAHKYNILKIALDNFRYALMCEALKSIGFDANDKKVPRVKLVRPSDIMKVVPIIDSCFARQCFVWGDNPVLRWATNNTKKIKSGIRTGNFTGNYVYGKIEPKSRKTDPFASLTAAMTIEDELTSGISSYDDLPVITG